MCQMLPARVISIGSDRAEIEMHGGSRATASCPIPLDLRPGDHVLVDRGIVLEKLAPEEVAAITAMYAEIGELLTAERDR